MPHSSAVCSWTVRSRHWQTSLRPSKAPIVMLLLPASRASSTYASCKNQGIGSIVLSHDEVACRVEACGSAFQNTFRLLHEHAPPRDVAGGVREEAQNGLGIFGGKHGDGAKQRDGNLLAREFAAGMDPKGGGLELGRERRMVYVDPDSGDSVIA